MVWATFRKSSRVNAYIIGFAIADAFAKTLKLDLKRILFGRRLIIAQFKV